MDDRIRICLSDIHESILQIWAFLPQKRDYSVYQNDLKTKKAVERNLEIIGEATKRILVINPDFPLPDSRRIVDTQNRISHGYDSISDDVIWAIIIRDLPILQQSVAALLKG
jgi:uncharacterized protein with HEPN domain